MKRLKVICVIILLLAYGLPLIINNDIIDLFYAIGTTLGIGGYLIVDSYKLNKSHEFYLLSAGVFFIGLAFVFIFDNIYDRIFRTYWYVVFNLLMTIICYFLLLYKKRFGRH